MLRADGLIKSGPNILIYLVFNIVLLFGKVMK